MPDFSVQYKMTVEDAVETSLSMSKSTRQKKFIMITVIAVIGMLVTCLISGEIYSIFVFGLIALIFPMVSYYSIKNQTTKAVKGRTDTMHPTRLDFYPDHIEKHTCVDGERKSHEEMHYPFEAVKFVLETKNIIAFGISPLEIVTFPKRELKPEDRPKVTALITNNFTKKYKRM